jgi:hypothetical protein
MSFAMFCENPARFSMTGKFFTLRDRLYLTTPEANPLNDAGTIISTGPALPFLPVRYDSPRTGRNGFIMGSKTREYQWGP